MSYRNPIVPLWVLVLGALLTSGHFLVGQSVLCPSVPGSAITYTLSAQSSEFHIGDKLIITVTVKNISQKKVPFWVENAADQGGLNFQFDVRYEQNALVHEGHFLRAMKGINDPQFLTPETPLARSGGCIDLLPGETRTYPIDVGRLYELTSQGTYEITLIRNNDMNKPVAISKVLAVTITSP